MMAFIPQCPLQKPICFVKQRKVPEENHSYNDYHNPQKEFWKRVADSRLRTAAARRKFTELSCAEISKKWERWDEADIDRFRIQFQIIDANEDGMIDFDELCDALDEMGDRSTTEERWRYFEELDTDHSDGIDFEEFLEFIDKALSSGLTVLYPTIAQMCNPAAGTETSTISGIKRLPIKHLIQHKLF